MLILLLFIVVTVAFAIFCFFSLHTGVSDLQSLLYICLSCWNFLFPLMLISLHLEKTLQHFFKNGFSIAVFF